MPFRDGLLDIATSLSPGIAAFIVDHEFTMSDSPSERKGLGDWGEKRAAAYLERCGYRILASKYRCQWGEVDLIAEEDGCIVFVEVRTRRGDSFGTPAESVTPRKQERLIATAETYLQAQETPPQDWRIDVITITFAGDKGRPHLEHLKNAVERS
jgi:putative endonuclease